jgi:predicted small metal-binding protein
MATRISCGDLGVANCDFLVDAEAVGDVMREMVHHLREVHHVDLPDADAILAGYMRDDPLDNLDPAVVLVIRRLREALQIDAPRGDPTVEPRIFPAPGPNLNVPSGSRGNLTQ